MNVITLAHKSTNCYLIPSVNGWLMVDTGLPDTFSQLLQLLYQNNVSVNEINYLVITHYHPGHAGLTQNLKDLGINLLLHEYQVSSISKLNLYFKKNPKAYFRDIMSTNNIVLNDENSRSFLKSIGVDGELVYTPGHSDDSVSLIIDDGYAFVGDLPDMKPAQIYEDIVIEDSWDMIKKHNVRTIYPGHGDPYDIIV